MPVNTSKRLYTQSTSDCINEPVQVNTVVVIQPGSYNLRIGHASDPLPVCLPHCVARKRTSTTVPEYVSPWLIRPETKHPGVRQQKEQGLRAINLALEEKPMDSGEVRPPSSVSQLYSNNVKVKGERTNVLCPQKWTNTDKEPESIIGEEALFVKPGTGYSLHWPMRRGHLNIHEGPGGTLNAVMADIELIWGTAIETMLDIPLKDLKYYRALLLVPDVYNHKHVRELMNVLLDKLGFGAAIVHQESVCGAFGSGVASACIVDVGDQKTSVCCVEDGISNKNTRLTMETGGCDITRVFCELLSKLGFSPPGTDLTLPTDVLTFQDLKEHLCHLDYNRYGYLEESVQVKRPGEYIMKYFIQIGDELVQAPLALFFPDIIGLQGDKLTAVQRRNEGDPADPHDEFYLRQVQSRQDPATKLSKKKENADNVREGPDLALDESGLMLQDEDSNDMPEMMAATDMSKTRRNELEEEVEEEEEEVIPPLMALDDAILYSISRCDTDEMKKKMYSCIIVVGGGLAFEGAQPWLQYCIWKNMPPQHRLMLETMDVMTRPKEMDPDIVCWKGASVLACLDTTQELWIKQKEWAQFDVRLLRERAPFVW